MTPIPGFAPSPAAAALLFVTVLMSITAAHAATVRVESHGFDSPSCGRQADTACRSITRGIANAAPGDTVLVGPGRYSSQQETGAPNCGCMLAVNKNVILISSHGAAETVIDGLSSGQVINVLLIMPGGEFGRPGRGFAVTDTGARFSSAIAIDSNAIKVRGNIVSARYYDLAPQYGISLVESPSAILIEGNEVYDFRFGIGTRGAGKTIRANVVRGHAIGIDAASGNPAIMANTIIGGARIESGAFGIHLAANSGAQVLGNGVYGNYVGIQVDSSFGGRIENNNISGNDNCGVLADVSVVAAPNNWWGSPNGPGPDPADDVCAISGSVSTSPFATTPFLRPMPFHFADVQVTTAGRKTSNRIKILGIDRPQAISVSGDTGAQYQINLGAFTNAPGTLNPGDTVRVRVNAPVQAGGSTDAELLVGGVSDAWTVLRP